MLSNAEVQRLQRRRGALFQCHARRLDGRLRGQRHVRPRLPLFDVRTGLGFALDKVIRRLMKQQDVDDDLARAADCRDLQAYGAKPGLGEHGRVHVAKGHQPE